MGEPSCKAPGCLFTNYRNPGHLAVGGQALDVLHDSDWRVLRPGQPPGQAFKHSSTQPQALTAAAGESDGRKRQGWQLWFQTDKRCVPAPIPTPRRQLPSCLRVGLTGLHSRIFCTVSLPYIQGGRHWSCTFQPSDCLHVLEVVLHAAGGVVATLWLLRHAPALAVAPVTLPPGMRVPPTDSPCQADTGKS